MQDGDKGKEAVRTHRIWSKRKEEIEQLVIPEGSRIQGNLLLVVFSLSENLSMVIVQGARGRGKQGLMMQGRVGKIDGATQEKDRPWTSTRMLPFLQNCRHYFCYCVKIRKKDNNYSLEYTIRTSVINVGI